MLIGSQYHQQHIFVTFILSKN